MVAAVNCSSPHSAGVPPTVTIILTNYNHARFLDCSLSAIVHQTRPADEVIVIDDGSTDDSLGIIERYSQEHGGIRVIRNDQNRGVQYTISRALGAATSDWIVWAAADDKLLPDFVKRGVDMIEQNPATGVVFSQLATFDDATGAETHYSELHDPTSAFHIGEGPTAFGPDELMARLQRSYMWLSGNTALVRRECLFDVGAFIPLLEWHSDWFAFYAVALRYGACGIPETHALMRVVPNTYSASGMRDPKRQAKVMAAILDILRRPEFSDLRMKFRARPTLFSPFPISMLKALLRRPKDWDLLVRLVTWMLSHRGTQYRNRLAHRRLPRGIPLRAMSGATHIALRIINASTPGAWKEAFQLSRKPGDPKSSV